MGSSKISIKTNHGIEIIKLKDIVCCIAHGRYSKIITIDGKEYFLTRLLKDLENSLSKEYFFRSHKSFLINLNHIKTYCRNKDCPITLTSGIKAQLAKRRVNDFHKKLEVMAHTL